MRCLACNIALSDFEATRRYAVSKEFLDLCERCYTPIKTEFRVLERLDLKEFEEMEQEKAPIKHTVTIEEQVK